MIMPTLNLNFSSRIKKLFAFIQLWRPRSTVHSYLPSVLSVYLVSLLQQKLSYLLHKAVVLSLSCLYHTDFWICGDSVAFYQYCSSYSERCFSWSASHSGSPCCAMWSLVSVQQCSLWIRTWGHWELHSAAGYRWLLWFTITKYIYLIVALEDSTESPTCCLLWQFMHFLALSKLQGKMCKWNTWQKVPILIKVLALLLPIQISQLMLWCLFPCGQSGFPLQAL